MTLKLKIIEDNLSTLTLEDLLKLKEALDRRIDAKIIASLVISIINFSHIYPSMSSMPRFLFFSIGSIIFTFKKVFKKYA